MSRSQRWDEEFSEFVAARSPQLYRQAWLLTSASHAAEDLVQTALVKTYASWWRVRKARDPVAYVHGILIKSFLSEWRRRSNSEIAMSEPPVPTPPHEDHTERLTIETALGRLSKMDRAVVVLRYWDDVSVTPRHVAGTDRSGGQEPQPASTEDLARAAQRTRRRHRRLDRLECTMNDLQSTETLVRDRLARATDDLPIPLARLNAGYLLPGRRLRRNRRAGVGMATAALALGVGFGVPHIVRALPQDDSSALAGDSASRPPAEGSETSPSTSSREPGWWDMPSETMLSSLDELLPAELHVTSATTSVPSKSGAGPEQTLIGVLDVVIGSDDADRVGSMEILLAPPESGFGEPAPDTSGEAPDGLAPDEENLALPTTISLIDCPSPSDGEGYGEIDCTELRDSTGHHYGCSLTWTDGTELMVSVNVLGPDGGVVTVTSTNALDPFGGDRTEVAPTPPLTRQQVQDLAEDPTWTSWTP